VRDLGGEAQFFATPLTKENEIEQLIDKLDRHFGRLDILVNNAGLGSRRAG
jgi:NAD(P)-dependent dehydrogenase (short-subunit alcohol dehydrogenase family)